MEDGRLGHSQGAKSWHQRMQTHVEGGKKLQWLRQILTDVRRRHVLEKIETTKWVRDVRVEVRYCETLVFVAHMKRK